MHALKLPFRNRTLWLRWWFFPLWLFFLAAIFFFKTFTSCISGFSLFFDIESFSLLNKNFFANFRMLLHGLWIKLSATTPAWNKLANFTILSRLILILIRVCVLFIFHWWVHNFCLFTSKGILHWIVIIASLFLSNSTRNNFVEASLIYLPCWFLILFRNVLLTLLNLSSDFRCICLNFLILFCIILGLGSIRLKDFAIILILMWLLFNRLTIFLAWSSSWWFRNMLKLAITWLCIFWSCWIRFRTELLRNISSWDLLLFISRAQSLF